MLDTVDATYREIRELSSDDVGTAFRVEVAERLETQQRVNRGLMYRFFGELGDPPDEAGRASGLIQKVAARLRIKPGEVKRRFSVAARIRPRRQLSGPPLPPALELVAEAVEAGVIGEDHLRVIIRALKKLPSVVSAGERVEVEASLVAEARKSDAEIVEAAAQGVDLIFNPDGDYDEADRARRRTVVLGPQGRDGMSRISGYVDPETRSYLEVAAAAVRPGRHRPDQHSDGSTDERPPVKRSDVTRDGRAKVKPPGNRPHTDDSASASDQPDTTADQPDAFAAEHDDRTPAQRCHDGLKLALKTALASGGLGQHRGHAVTVIARTTLAELNQAAHAVTDRAIPMPPPARTGGKGVLPMRDLIRMAADALHYLVVFDDHSDRPIYLGRQKRIATTDQRIICYSRDGGCTRPGCLEPGYHSEVHHAVEWAQGGRTDADMLYFACGPDHKQVTDGELKTVVTESGRLAWTDGSTPARVNRLHHPDEILRNDPGPPPQEE